MTTEKPGEGLVEKWMLSIVHDGGLERHDDLHIDQIDLTWRSRERWIDAGLYAFGLGLSVRDRLGLDLTLGLAFSLESGDQPRGVDFRTSAELFERLDWSPPSLYLFHRGKEPWRLTGPIAQPPPQHFCLVTMDAAEVFGEVIRASGCYALEFRYAASDEYSRSVFLVG